MEGLEATSTGSDVDWKGWKGRSLEGLDLDVVDGGLEGTLDPDVDWKGLIRTSIGRVGSGRRLERLGPDVDWKGWIRTSIGRVGSGRR